MKQRSRKSSLAPMLLAAAAALSSCALPMAHSQSLRASFSPSTSDAESGFQGVDSSPSSSSSSSSTSSSSLSAESGPQHIRSQSSSPQPNNKNASPDDDDTNEVEESSLTKPKHFPLTVKLSTSTHHRASNTNNKGGRINSISNGLSNSPEIPLVGIGVGNLPHNKIPYILANALAGAQYQNTIVNKSNSGNNKLTGVEVDDYVNYRLIDTSHTSALEVLVGRSLGRLFGTAGTSVSNSNNLSNGSRNRNNLVKDNTSYHVMIKVWHTHLGYERTMLSIQDSLSDILPGSSGTNASGATINSAITNSNSHLNNQGIGTLSTTSDISYGKKRSPSSSYPSPNNRIGNTSILIHAILQYPRCYDTLFQSQTYLSSQSYSYSSSSSSLSSTANTRHTSCLEEEESLDSTIHATGPSPLHDKDNAWKRSYRALEELYHHGTLESIGVANFERKDMEELYDLATVGPHIYQGSLRTLMTERELVEGLVKHGVHFQCYDAVSVILGGREVVPRAYGRLERMGARFGGIMQEDFGGDGMGGRPTSGVDDDYGVNGIHSSYGYSAIQVVLGWLVQRGVGVLPGTKNLTHLMENGPMSLSTMPEFTPRESLDIENAVMAFVYGVDLEDDNTVLDGNFGVNSETKVRFKRGEFGSEEIVYDETITEHHINRKETPVDEGVVATFFNSLRRNIRIFHVHPTTGRQIQVSGSIPPGRSGRLIVNPRDVLIAYDGYGVAVKKFLVNADHGGRMDFSVEL